MLAGTLLGWRVAGNSWRPLCEAVLEDPAAPLVCELSSFQLWYLRETRPRFDAAILTLLAVDHLDWHPDAAHYRACKLSLLGWAAAAWRPRRLPLAWVRAVVPTPLGVIEVEQEPGLARIRLPAGIVLDAPRARAAGRRRWEIRL